MNNIDRRFTLWLSGYYEDFQTMRVISEGENYAEATFFTNRRDSHAGNTMAAQAFNNSRFTYDFLTRSRTVLMPLPIVGMNNAGDAATLHNEGPSQWLTHDPNRIGSTFYEGRATLTYPDTISDAASIRTFTLPKRADYSHFASGWGTQNTYWVRNGDADATYERSGFEVDATHGNPFGANSTRGYAKFQIDGSGTQPADLSGIPKPTVGGFDNTNYRKHKVMMSSSLCGVYLGETGDVAFQSSSIGLPFAYLHPIKSPSGKPFYRHTISKRYADWVSANVSSTGGGKNKYNFANGANFGNVGGLGADDQWFPLNQVVTSVVTTGQTYSSGATTVVIPGSIPSPPPTTNILDPSIPQHLPQTNNPSALGTPVQTLLIDGVPVYYTSFNVNLVSGDVTFNLTAGLPITFIQPTIGILRWEDQQVGDNTITYYNLTAGGTPDVSPIWQNRQDVGDGGGYPLL